MKKKVITFGVILFVIILFLSQFGIEIGNIRIGKQLDLSIKQNSNFEKSDFYKKYYSKEKLIVLNIWATWCEPCIEEIPILNEEKENNIDKNVEFLSLSIDTDSVKLQKFLNTKKFEYNDITILNLEYRNAIINTLENKKADKWISSTIIPMTYIIKNKQIVYKFNGEVEKNEIKQQINKFK